MTATKTENAEGVDITQTVTKFKSIPPVKLYKSFIFLVSAKFLYSGFTLFLDLYTILISKSSHDYFSLAANSVDLAINIFILGYILAKRQKLWDDLNSEDLRWHWTLYYPLLGLIGYFVDGSLLKKKKQFVEIILFITGHLGYFIFVQIDFYSVKLVIACKQAFEEYELHIAKVKLKRAENLQKEADEKRKRKAAGGGFRISLKDDVKGKVVGAAKKVVALNNAAAGGNQKLNVATVAFAASGASGAAAQKKRPPPPRRNVSVKLASAASSTAKQPQAAVEVNVSENSSPVPKKRPPPPKRRPSPRSESSGALLPGQSSFEE
eukprot:CAMPEP_0175130852 /NCGR_PEP_ID=MMETSP0087-20121206/6222_1 /TAXON_ID=136419 /ORGANISM="Unknown Unknown, Strain D1" /LENGTH=321 /DNA_ID=CAMNT_0016413087 /DNA_START=574 /DNA_END=1539 /DNA_ORIENTATION=+